MKVAILGGGFAGISLAWYLLHYTLGASRIDIYDPAPVAMGASRISLGILNPYMGKQAKPGWDAQACVREVHRLLTESATACCQPLVIAKGVLRPAQTAEQITQFQARAQEHSETQWWDAKQCREHIPYMHLPEEGGGLYIPHAITINVEQYLRGLWISILRHSARYMKLTVLSKETLAPYERIVVALGANTLDFAPLKNLPMTRIKGQILQIEWPEHLSPLPMSIAAEGQLVMAPDHKSCFIGSTYEKEFTDFKADLDFARTEILGKVSALFPMLNEAKVLGCRARMRGCSKSHLPMIGRLNEKVWFYTGLGSKGLLHHAWASRHCAQALLLNDLSLIPKELFVDYSPAL